MNDFPKTLIAVDTAVAITMISSLIFFLIGGYVNYLLTQDQRNARCNKELIKASQKLSQIRYILDQEEEEEEKE